MSNPSAQNPSRGGGLSLYANLLDPAASNTTSAASISRGPVVFKQGATEGTQVDDASVKKQQINPGTY
jgi:splicing factor 45